ncbi:MAG: hypothetical protein ABI175_10730 [Polyangiales bacterium]
MACRAWTALSTVVVALVLALTMPVSQLRTARVEKSCCCPDPAKCHCPDHDDRTPAQPELRACHQTTHVSVAPTLPAFAAPALAEVIDPVVATIAVIHATHAPHAAPAPARPDAPS